MNTRAVRAATSLAAASALICVLSACAPVGSAAPDVEKGEGSFVVQYDPASTSENQTEQNLWQQAGLLEAFADAMNKTVALPKDVAVVAKDCQEANAFYDPATSSISLCYELSASERSSLEADAVGGDAAGEEPVDQQLLESARAVLYHEAGHALLAELGLAFTGREEDVADQYSVYALTDSEEDADSLITVAKIYYLNAQSVTDVDELPFSDTHGLDAQRSANFLCYVYGAYPERYEYLVQDGTLDSERAGGCQEEFAQLSAGWESLLRPHLRSTNGS